MRLKHTIVLAACFFALSSGHAFADIAPPDICQGEGTVCDNAGPAGQLPGICTASTCSSPEPKPDGGIIYRDCLRCMPASGGAGGSAGAGAGGSAGAGTGGLAGADGSGTPASGAPSAGSAGASGTPDDGGCSCRLSSTAGERTLAATMLLVGFAALRARRRRH